MASAKNTAPLRRDAPCNVLQCLSAIAKIGIALCIVLVTLGSAFTYYWAFVRGRRDKDTGSQIDDSVRELSVINPLGTNLTSPHPRSPGANGRTIIHRPTPTLQDTTATSSQNLSYNTAMPHSIRPSQFILPGPPMVPPAYAMQQQPGFVPFQAPVALRPTSLPTPALGFPSGALGHPGQRLSCHEQRRSTTQPRQPSPGYASTIPDLSPAHGRSSLPGGRRSRRESPLRGRSRPSSSLDTETRVQFENLIAQSGVAEPVDEDNDRHSSTSGAAGRRSQRRHTLDSHARENQPCIGHPRIQCFGEPHMATCRARQSIFRVGDTRVGREHGRESCSRRRASQSRFLSTFLGPGESFVCAQGHRRCVSGDNQLGQLPTHSSPENLFRARDSSIGRKERGHNPPIGHSRGATQAENINGPSPAQSGVSSTGAICSFEGSDWYPQESSLGHSSQRYRHATSRSLSDQRGLARPRRVLSNPESLLSPRSTDSRDLSLASEEEGAEDDGRRGQHN